MTDERPATPLVVVLGGGLAGVACAHRLAWDDDVADRPHILLDPA